MTDIQGNGGGRDYFLVKTGLRFRTKLRFRMSLWLKQRHHLCFGFFGLFLVKIGLRFRIKLKFRTNLCPKLHKLPCLFGLARPLCIQCDKSASTKINRLY